MDRLHRRSLLFAWYNKISIEISMKFIHYTNQLICTLNAIINYLLHIKAILSCLGPLYVGVWSIWVQLKWMKWAKNPTSGSKRKHKFVIEGCCWDLNSFFLSLYVPPHPWQTLYRQICQIDQGYLIFHSSQNLLFKKNWGFAIVNNQS